MAEHSTIEWTEATWNPITGCSVVSPGCTNCYAMRLAGTRLAHHPSRAGLTCDTKAGPVWTGEVRLNEKWLAQPLRWRRPRRIFVCAHGDLFHEAVPDAWIDKVFAIMALSPRHTFQVLTKRARRMRAYLSAARAHAVGLEALGVTLHEMARNPRSDVGRGCILQGDIAHLKVWPLPHVWLGVSVEDQPRADERIPDLLATPAAVRWVSAEPLLGPINFRALDIDGDSEMDALLPPSPAELWRSYWAPAITGTTLEEAIEAFEDWGLSYPPSEKEPRGLDWVVVGGESGPDARPMRVEWARAIVEQCSVAGVACFVKQLGPAPIMNDSDAVQAVALGAGWDRLSSPDDRSGVVGLRNRKGSDMLEWPTDLRVQEFPHASHDPRVEHNGQVARQGG